MAKKYPLHGRFVDSQSIDEKEKLIRYPNVKVLPENWELVNFASFNFLQDENTALIISQLLNAMGVKIISSNVALTSLNTFPNYVGYIPQNRERLLLISQTNPLQNGFYEWQTGGTLIRLYDWRDIIVGNGLSINANNIAVKLLEYLLVPARNDNFLQFDVHGKLFARIASDAVGLKLNANREIYIDTSELGGGGGGVSTLDVPHPDIDSVTGATVLLVGTSGTINVNGGNFRRDNTLICDGFTVTSYVNRKHNINSALVQATNLVGIHNILSKHLTLDSENTGDRTFTVLGAAVIDTVTPRAKRNTTTQLTVTGEGFALLSQFASNDVGIAIVLNNVTNRFLVNIGVTVDNAVNSGLYNLVCTNSFGANTFTSGTSGNNKLEIFGDPNITAVWRDFNNQLLAEILLGETVTIDARGFDLTNEASINPSGITVNSISGTITQKNISVTGSSNKADIGVKNLVIIDTPNSSDSGTSGNGKVALNYAYSNTVFRKPTTFRAFGGAVLSDWVITQNTDDITIERIGGSGVAYLEITDLFLVASLLEFSLGGQLTFINFVVETLPNDLDINSGISICIAPIGSNISGFLDGEYYVNVTKDDQNPNFYGVKNSSTNVESAQATTNIEIRTSRSGLVGQNTQFISSNNAINLGSIFYQNYTSHENKAVFIAMLGNYRMRLSLKGWIGD